MITGNTLIELGYKPEKWFKEAIEYANKNNLTGLDLEVYLKSVCPPKIEYIEPHIEPLHYHRNIVAETENEIENIKSVFATMDILMKTPTLVNGCVMPDSCPTGEIGQIPVGGVEVAKNAIHPSFSYGNKLW
jgi:hypothetical protein